MSFEGKVALVTGGANGLGRATAGRLVERGAKVVLADIEADSGNSAADELGAEFVPTDVSDPEASVAAVAYAVGKFGRLDMAFLNAGISTGCGVAEFFDLDKYRRAMGVNIDGVVFGFNAVLPAIREAGGGSIVATASLAGLTGTPPDPIYAANKHAVVGLVRSLAPIYEPEGIAVNAICPGYAETRIISDFRHELVQDGTPIIAVSEVVDAVEKLFESPDGGNCVFVQAGRSDVFRFRNVPGPRV